MKAVWVSFALVAPAVAFSAKQPEPAGAGGAVSGVSSVLSDLLIRDASREGELRHERDRAVKLSTESEELKTRLATREKTEKKLRQEAKLSDWAWSAIRTNYKRERENERRTCLNRTTTLQHQVHVCTVARKRCQAEQKIHEPELAALRQDIEWERARRVEAEDRVRDLAKKLSIMSKEKTVEPELQGEVDAAEETELKAVKRELSTVAADLASKSVDLRAAQAELKDLRSERQENEMPAQHVVESEEKALKAERAWRKSASKELAETHRRLVDSAVKIQEAHADTLAKEKELNSTRDELTNAREELNTTHADAAHSREELDKTRADAAHAREELNKTLVDAAHAREELNKTRVDAAVVGKELSEARAKMVSVMMEVFDLKKATESQIGDLKKLHAELMLERSGAEKIEKSRNMLAARDKALALALDADDKELQHARAEARAKDEDLQATKTQAVSESKEVNALRIEVAIARAGSKAAHAEQNILGILTKELNESRAAFAVKTQELDSTRNQLASAQETASNFEYTRQQLANALESAKACNKTNAGHTARGEATTSNAELPKKGNATKEAKEVTRVKATREGAPTKVKLLPAKDKELDAARLLIKTLEEN
jgi:hypothetical protein